MIYLDSAATTLQKPPAVARASAQAINQMASPGRGGHQPAMKAADVAFACREEVASLFHIDDPEQVVFTMNATHALNIAIKTLVKPGANVVISGWEHNAVTRPLHAIEGISIKIASAPMFDPVATIEAFSRALTPEVDVAIFTHVSNVFGFILPIREIAALCRQRGIAFIVDASQSAGCIELDVQALGAAFVAMPGHKGLMGPQGTGILLCNQMPQPLMEGGTGSESIQQRMPAFLPDRLEAGTHNIPGIAGLLEGVRFIRKKGVERIHQYENQLIQAMGTGLCDIPGVQVFLAQDPAQQAGVLSFRVSAMDCEELGGILGQKNVAVRTGLHCAPTAHASANTLETGTVRASVSPFNQHQEIERFLKILRTVV